jgi:hypothetical protein
MCKIYMYVYHTVLVYTVFYLTTLSGIIQLADMAIYPPVY